MRKFTTIVAALLLSVATFAQAPQGFSYQAVVRDAQNAIVANQEVDVTLTITAEIDGVALQTYTEKHSVTTNANGLLTLVVGQGESSQKLSDIKWNLPNAIYNMRTETKYGAATTQLLSVPFAMYAEQAGDIDVNQLAKKLNSSDVQALLGLVRAEDLEEIRKYINDSLAAYGNTYIKKTDVNVLTNNYVTKEVFENYVVSGGNPEAVDLSVYAKNADVEKTYAKKDDVEKTYAKKDDIRKFTTMRDVKDTVGFYYAKKADLDQYAPFRYVADTFNYIRSSYAPKEYVSKNYVTKEAFDNYVLSGGQTESVDLTVYAKSADVEKTYAKKADIPSLSGYALKSDIPTMPTVPTKVSELQNDANYLTSHQDISGKQDVIDDLDDIRSGAALGATALQSHQDISGKANKSEMSITPGANAGTAVIKLQDNMQETVLTAHQSLEGYYSKADVDSKINAFSEDLLTGSYALKDEIDGPHDYVDLGLPSHTLWATCNVGATEPQQAGDYYGWGQTEVPENLDYSSWTFFVGSFPRENDAAAVHFGGLWETPSADQWQELFDNCLFENVTDYAGTGQKGLIVYMAKNASDRGKTKSDSYTPSADYSLTDVHIFLPKVGIYDRNSYISTTHVYLTKSSYKSGHTERYIGAVITNSRSVATAFMGGGYPVRPVRNNATPATLSDFSDYYTKTQSDGRYVLKTDAYTKTESDNRYVLKEKVYTKAEVDAIVSEKIGFLRMEGEIEGKFSVSASKKVAFSQGNLQYKRNGSSNMWRFAEYQYETTEKPNRNSYYNSYYQTDSDGWTDLFCWGTSGWNGSGFTYYSPHQLYFDQFPQTATSGPNYTAFNINSNSATPLAGTKADWGVYNAISNGENKAGVWRTLTSDEWLYLLNTRTDAAKKRFKVEISLPNDSPVPSNSNRNVPGILLLPDDFDITIDDPKTSVDDRLRNVMGTDDRALVTEENLEYLESNYGVVFLPDWNGIGRLTKHYENNVGLMFVMTNETFMTTLGKGVYWTATPSDNYAYVFDPSESNTETMELETSQRNFFFFVRLVRDIKF